MYSCGDTTKTNILNFYYIPRVNVDDTDDDANCWHEIRRRWYAGSETRVRPPVRGLCQDPITQPN